MVVIKTKLHEANEELGKRIVGWIAGEPSVRIIRYYRGELSPEQNHARIARELFQKYYPLSTNLASVIGQSVDSKLFIWSEYHYLANLQYLLTTGDIIISQVKSGDTFKAKGIE